MLVRKPTGGVGSLVVLSLSACRRRFVVVLLYQEAHLKLARWTNFDLRSYFAIISRY